MSFDQDVVRQYKQFKALLSMAMDDVVSVNEGAGLKMSAEDIRQLLTFAIPGRGLRDGPPLLYLAHVREMVMRHIQDDSYNDGTVAEAYAALLEADPQMKVVPFADTLLGGAMIQLLWELSAYLGCPADYEKLPPNVTAAELKALWREVENNALRESREVLVKTLKSAAYKERQYYDALGNAKQLQGVIAPAPAKSDDWFGRMTNPCAN